MKSAVEAGLRRDGANCGVEMFDRGVLFVGAGPYELGLLAEAVALDYIRASARYAPIRFYAATLDEPVGIDPLLLRALKKLELDASGLSQKPMALYSMIGAPQIDHVVSVGRVVPKSTLTELLGTVDCRVWAFGKELAAAAPPGTRYAHYLERAHDIKAQLPMFAEELADLGALSANQVAATA
ncbi:MAG: hypothetical protein AAGH60_04395 [Pseudomonadota bacterium]